LENAAASNVYYNEDALDCKEQSVPLEAPSTSMQTHLHIAHPISTNEAPSMTRGFINIPTSLWCGGNTATYFRLTWLWVNKIPFSVEKIPQPKYITACTFGFESSDVLTIRNK
jgi:hypothetical protein